MSIARNLRALPIVLAVLAHTQRIDGDDAGYRQVPVSPLDAPGTSDPLVVCNDRVKCVPVYSVGAVPGLCPYYGTGIGSSPTVLLRAPALNALEACNGILEPYNRQVVIVDGFRDVETQALLWKDLYFRLLNERQLREDCLSVTEFIQLGLDADDIGSYAELVHDDTYQAQIDRWSTEKNTELKTAADTLGKSFDEVVYLYVTFLGNLKRNSCILDETRNTAHGNGGAADCFLWNTEKNQFSCLGVPFDFVGAPSEMDWFENSANLEQYNALIGTNDGLRTYLTECGMLSDEKTTVTAEDFESIRDERRLLFNAMSEVGATIYNKEPWHFNLSNFYGGLNLNRLYGAGSGCHSLLRNVTDLETGMITAAWGNAEAHRQARELLAA